MSVVDIEAFNADWLKAWSDKDTERLVSFYSEDTVYMDPQTAGGLKGRGALRTYLQGLFGATPEMVYVPEAVWVIEGGFCGRWICTVGPDGAGGKLRGFDLVLLKDGEITHNEVYVHQLPA
ncbi:conserved hypothetical protein [Hyphomonas neptunium ATCC 15444]|uniref:SnoaL-like domain-containing protein n=2 Tax=Hyphomonas TaxID=85 RepID=Q0C3I0_HYPNA|nr:MULTISPECIES: nuclear transport factor 2 family protein [Hyphomonas]ABI77398.1 conserved hypothetical protein [Hyphomonas neptunium ATCC 15444]KCZ96078.1 hypothetical protein HHI_00325 [Hyphomonas hirschiana VP5]